MSGTRPKISELVNELKQLYQELETIKLQGYWVFSVKDLENMAGSSPTFPMVGIVYDGGSKTDGNTVKAVSRQGSSLLTDLTFTAILGIPYTFGVDGHTIVNITDVLDEALESILGYTNINSRPWDYVGESQVDSDLEGVVFYGQVWSTSIINLGKFKNI